MPEEGTAGNYNVRFIPLEIKGFPGMQPKRWTQFDRPTEEEKIASWDARMTEACDAFGVQRGDFRRQSWAGKVGKVHIGKHAKTGYMEVKWAIVEKQAAPMAPAPHPVAPQPAAPPPKAQAFGAVQGAPRPFKDNEIDMDAVPF
jgi:hypothetical protein